MTAVTAANAVTAAPTTTFTRLVLFASPDAGSGSSTAPDGSGGIAAIGSVGGPPGRNSAYSGRAGDSAGARAGPHNELRAGGSFPGSSKTGDPFTSGTFHLGGRAG
ncbi:hypothetical protein [Amycolatopsis sp. NPDC003861]